MDWTHIDQQINQLEQEMLQTTSKTKQFITQHNVGHFHRYETQAFLQGKEHNQSSKDLLSLISDHHTNSQAFLTETDVLRDFAREDLSLLSVQTEQNLPIYNNFKPRSIQNTVRMNLLEDYLKQPKNKPNSGFVVGKNNIVNFQLTQNQSSKPSKFRNSKKQTDLSDYDPYAQKQFWQGKLIKK